MPTPGTAGSAFAIGASEVGIERGERTREPREELRADVGESASKDHLPRPATRSVGA